METHAAGDIWKNTLDKHDQDFRQTIPVLVDV